jgi:hypothetical protein
LSFLNRENESLKRKQQIIELDLSAISEPFEAAEESPVVTSENVIPPTKEVSSHDAIPPTQDF